MLVYRLKCIIEEAQHLGSGTITTTYLHSLEDVVLGRTYRDEGTLVLNTCCREENGIGGTLSAELAINMVPTIISSPTLVLIGVENPLNEYHVGINNDHKGQRINISIEE